MRPFLGTARRRLFSAIVMLGPLFGGGCTLVQPGCRNRDVKASIEKDARESLDFTGSTSGLPAAPADTTVSLVDQVEVGRHDNTRSCTANVAVVIGRESVPVPIEYEVTAGADGEAYYQWDKFSFGKKLIGTALMSALLDMAQAKSALLKKQETAQQPDTTPAPEPPPAATPWPQAATAPFNVMEAWKKKIRSEIVARAEKLTDMPAGKQRMRFRIGPGGEITMAKALEPVENPDLAERLATFLEGPDLVTKPPLNRGTWIEVTFNF